jgi:hypothetical protein
MNDCIPYTGYQFNEIFGCMEFIKITTTEEKENYSQQLYDGINEFKFTENYGHLSGGIKFHEFENIFEQLSTMYNAVYIRHVIIPDDANVVQKNDHFLADKIILSGRQLLSKIEILSNPDIYLKQLLKYPKIAKYVKNIPEDLGLELVTKDPSLIESIDNPTEEMCIRAVSKTPYYITKIKNRSMNIYKALIKNNAHAITYITPLPQNEMLELIDYNPEILRSINSSDNDTKEISLSKNGLYLQYILCKTKSMCEIAFLNNPNAIKFMPNNLKTYDMCLNAVMFNIDLFNEVPQEFMDNDLCLYVLTKDPQLISKIKEPTDLMYLECSKTNPSLLGKIKDSSLIKDMGPLEIIKVNPNHIKNVDNPTYEMCFEAVKKDGQLINIIPIEFQDEKMCITAAQNDGSSIKYLLSLKQTEQVCFEAINQNIQSFRYIRFLTENIVKYILNLNCEFIGEMQYLIEDNDFLKEMQMLCVNKCPMILKSIQYPTLEMCKKAVDGNYKSLQFVPDELLCDDLYNLALSQNAKALKYIKNQTENICDYAINNNPLAIKYVKNKFLTYDLCVTAIKKNYRAIEKIKLQNIELCLIAVMVNERAVSYIRNLDENMCIHLSIINYRVIPHIADKYLRNRCEYLTKQLIKDFMSQA